jgi:tetratricopeptide (TPR) repeat protein
VNIAWGIFNLIPVLPLDGGHVLEHALGPRRIRLTAGISFLAAGSLAVLSLRWGMFWIGILFVMSAIQSFNRFRTEPDITAANLERSRPRTPPEDPVPGELLALIRRARRALADDRLVEAIALADKILATDPAPPRPAAREAHEVLSWARLLSDDVKGAVASLAQARRLGEPDRALAAAVHRALGEVRQARRILEEARAAGDDRKEIVGPLIQILIEAGEVPRAAALALDIVDSLSEEDARKMAEIAFEHGAFEWSAHLYEAVFRRNGEGEDAYGAARASAKDGNLEKALELLRRAVEAGFTDRARAWSDAALEPLRSGPLETVLPRP